MEINNKSILLFSSGLDSFILKKLYSFPDHQCLFVNMGTQENEIEEGVVRKYFPDVPIKHLPISEYELGNKIIPFRNSFLALLAAQYGNDIWFAFTSGDTTKDKDYIFSGQMEGLFNYFSLDEEKVNVTGPFSIKMPLKSFSKSEIVGEYLRKGFPQRGLIDISVSCYSGGSRPCGICRSCLRKYVAVTLNHVYWNFDHPSDKVMDDFLRESITKNRKFEINDIKKCIELRKL